MQQCCGVGDHEQRDPVIAGEVHPARPRRLQQRLCGWVSRLTALGERRRRLGVSEADASARPEQARELRRRARTRTIGSEIAEQHELGAWSARLRAVGLEGVIG